MWFVLLCVVLLLLLSTVWRWRSRRLIALHERFGSGIAALPVLGHAYLFLTTDNKKTMKNIIRLGEDARSRGGVNSFWLVHKLVLNFFRVGNARVAPLVLQASIGYGNYFPSDISEPEMATAVLKACCDKGDTMLAVREFAGNASIFAPVEIWRPRKKRYVSPALTTKNVNSFFKNFVRNCNVMLEQLENRELRGAKGVVSVFNYFMLNILDNATETAFGSCRSVQLNPDSPIKKAVENIADLGGNLQMNFWAFYKHANRVTSSYKQFLKNRDVIFDYVDEFVKIKLNEWQKAEEAEKNQMTKSDDDASEYRTCLVEVMLRAGERDPIVLREESMSIMLAATDTSTLSASFVSLMLAQHPRVQDRVCKELQEVFGDSDRPITLEDLPRMKYLEAVIKETQRLYPPVSMVMREAHEDILLPTGVTIPKGCFIMIHIYGVHRNQEVWGPDADEFRPERFLEGPLKHPSAFLAFTLGPRGCPGGMYATMGLKVNLSGLLRRYRLLPAPDAPRVPPLRYCVVTKTDNFNVLLEHRTNLAT